MTEETEEKPIMHENCVLIGKDARSTGPMQFVYQLEGGDFISTPFRDIQEYNYTRRVVDRAGKESNLKGLIVRIT